MVDLIKSSLSTRSSLCYTYLQTWPYKLNVSSKCSYYHHHLDLDKQYSLIWRQILLTKCWDLVDEMTRCQFHQNFTSSFFIQMFFCAAFICLQFGFVIFFQKDFGTKGAHKMLVTLTPTDKMSWHQFGSSFILLFRKLNTAAHLFVRTEFLRITLCQKMIVQIVKYWGKRVLF